MSDREVRDIIRVDDEFFDRETGCSYMTRPPLGERQSDVSPLDFLRYKESKCRFSGYSNPDQIHDIFRRSGFETIKAVPMILPKKAWRASGKAGFDRQAEQLKFTFFSGVFSI